MNYLKKITLTTAESHIGFTKEKEVFKKTSESGHTLDEIMNSFQTQYNIQSLTKVENDDAYAEYNGISAKKKEFNIVIEPKPKNDYK